MEQPKRHLVLAYRAVMCQMASSHVEAESFSDALFVLNCSRDEMITREKYGSPTLPNDFARYTRVKWLRQRNEIAEAFRKADAEGRVCWQEADGNPPNLANVVAMLRRNGLDPEKVDNLEALLAVMNDGSADAKALAGYVQSVGLPLNVIS
jgi:hypothetical protein